MLEEAGDESEDDDTSFLTDDSMKSGFDPSKRKKKDTSANQPEPQREPVQPPPTQASAP